MQFICASMILHKYTHVLSILCIGFSCQCYIFVLGFGAGVTVIHVHFTRVETTNNVVIVNLPRCSANANGQEFCTG